MFSFSSSNTVDNGDFSEFWNRADEASSSEESISDSDGISFLEKLHYVISDGAQWESEHIKKEKNSELKYLLN